MEKRPKKSMKSEANYEVGSLTTEGNNSLENVNSNKDDGRTAKIGSGQNDKHGRTCTVENKLARSDFGKELFPTNSPREVRGRTKLPPFRIGRYVPSDGYLYSSWSFAITDEICDEKGKDVESKNRMDKAKNKRVAAKEEAKETRIQSASFHGLETERARPKLRTRCRSTDCSRVAGQNGIRLSSKISNCMRELGDGKKSRIKCLSADISKLSVQDDLNYHDTGSSPCIRDSSTKNNRNSKERNSLENTLSSTDNSPTRKGKTKENKHEFGSCLSSSKGKTSSRRFNPGSSTKRTVNGNEKTASDVDSLQRTTQVKGIDVTDLSVNNPSVRTNVDSTNRLEISPLRSGKKNEDTSGSSSRNEQNSPSKTGKSKAISTASPQLDGKEVNTDVSHSPSRNEQNIVGKAFEVEKKCSKASSSDEKNVGNCSKVSTDISQVDSTQIDTKIKPDQHINILDCKTREKENSAENKSNEVEGITDVENGVEKTSLCDTIFEDTNMKANCSDDIENVGLSASQPNETLAAVNGKTNKDSKTCDTKDSGQDRPRANVKLQRNNKNKLTKKPSNEKKTSENDHSSADLNKNSSQKDKLSNLSKNPEGKNYSPGRRFSGGNNKYQYEKKTVDCKVAEQSTAESSRKLAFQRRESYSKQLREKNMRNAELKKKVGMVNKGNGVRLQEDSAVTVKIKHVKSRRLLRRNVAYVKREQKIHFSQEHDHDSWILFTVTLDSALVGHHTGLDLPDGRNSPELCKPAKALLCCVLPKCGNVIPKVKNVLVRSQKSNLKRLSLLPVKKLRWCLFDAVVI